MDNLFCQTKKSYVNDLAACGTVHHLGEPNSTHVWQMIDRGVGKINKDLFREVQEEYMWQGSHFQGYLALKAWQRRVLFTQWVGEARRRYLATYAEPHRKICHRSGLLVTIDSAHDRLVSVESSTIFVLQPLVEWPTIAEECDSMVYDDLEGAPIDVEEPAFSEGDEESSSAGPNLDSDSDSDSSDCKSTISKQSTSQSSSSSSSSEQSDAEEATGSSSSTAPLLTVEETAQMLRGAKARGKMKEAVKHLNQLASSGTRFTYPKKHEGKLLRPAVLQEAIDAIEIPV